MKNGSKKIVVLAIMALTAFALYYYMVNRADMRGPEVETTVVQDILLTNLEDDYPATVREVVKFYNEITQCYYNEEYTDEQLELLAQKAMELYDEELVANQDEVQYMANLEAEIKKYKDNEVVISTVSLASATDVDYFTYGGRECAKIRCIYTLRKGTNLQTIKEVYVLRKDDAEHWKILGWDLADDMGDAEFVAGKDGQAGADE